MFGVCLLAVHPTRDRFVRNHPNYDLLKFSAALAPKSPPSGYRTRVTRYEKQSKVDADKHDSDQLTIPWETALTRSSLRVLQAQAALPADPPGTPDSDDSCRFRNHSDSSHCRGLRASYAVPSTRHSAARCKHSGIPRFQALLGRAICTTVVVIDTGRDPDLATKARK